MHYFHLVLYYAKAYRQVKTFQKCGALMRDIYLVLSPILLGMPGPPKCFTLCIKEYLAWLSRQ
jgi:hypothetical protein